MDTSAEADRRRLEALAQADEGQARDDVVRFGTGCLVGVVLGLLAWLVLFFYLASRIIS